MKFAVKPSLPILVASLAAFLALAPSAHAEGTVTVSINGKGDVTGDGIACSEAAGSDCSEAYEDVEHQDCDPERKPPCFTVSEPPAASFTAGADRNGYSFTSWSGCDATSGGGRTCELLVDGDTAITANFADVTNPMVSGLSPASGVRRGTITVSASATDNSGTVTRVDFSVGGATVSDTTAPYSISFNTASISDGVKAVGATAFDPAGRSSTTTGSITVDNTAPGVTVTGGPNGQTFGPGSTQTWSFTASDATSGLQSVQCSVVPTGAAASFGACSGGSGSHSVSGRPDGSYTFSVRARDAAGNETIQSRSFAIDAAPPETSITGGPGDGSSASGDVTFTFGAGEPGSTFACRVTPSGVTPGAFAPCSGSGTHTAPGLSPGTYSFEVVATDPYGNVDASPAKRTFSVVPPGTDGDGGGTGGGGSGRGTGGTPTTPSEADLTGPTWTFKSASRQRSAKTRRIAFKLGTNESCALVVTARLGKKTLGKLTKSLAAGEVTTHRVKLTKKGLKALRRALRRKRTVSVTLTIACVDGAGNTSKASRKVKIRR